MREEIQFVTHTSVSTGEKPQHWDQEKGVSVALTHITILDGFQTELKHFKHTG